MDYLHFTSQNQCRNVQLGIYNEVEEGEILIEILTESLSHNIGNKVCAKCCMCVLMTKNEGGHLATCQK